MLIQQNKINLLNFFLASFTFFVAITENIFAKTNSSKDVKHEITKAEEFPVNFKAIRLPVISKDHKFNFLIMDVVINCATVDDQRLVEIYKYKIIDLILVDTFNSAQILLRDKKKITEKEVDMLRKRIWIKIYKLFQSTNGKINITSILIKNIKYLTK